MTTVLDDDGSIEDVQLIIDDDMVYIKQYRESSTFEDIPDIIAMTPDMFSQLLDALKLPEGLYHTATKEYES